MTQHYLKHPNTPESEVHVVVGENGSVFLTYTAEGDDGDVIMLHKDQVAELMRILSAHRLIEIRQSWHGGERHSPMPAAEYLARLQAGLE